jgi:hypothetical protein
VQPSDRGKGGRAEVTGSRERGVRAVTRGERLRERLEVDEYMACGPSWPVSVASLGAHVEL